MDQSANAQSRLNDGHGLFEVTGRPRAFLRPGIVSVTTVSAAFRFEGRSTAFRYVTLFGPTHDDEPIREGPHPSNYAEPSPPPNKTDAVLLSLNSEPGCIKVVDTFRQACRARPRRG